MLALANWISSYYCAPLGEVLRGMMPLAGEIRRGKLYGLTDSGRDAAKQLLLGASDEQPAVALMRLLEARPLTASYLKQKLPNAVAALSHAAFSPYSDFLLHDMGALGDGIVQNQAGPTLMRTAPLWGLRFEPTYLHDGRARTPDEAIHAHDGQARPAANAYAHLNATQKAQLLAFLNSL